MLESEPAKIPHYRPMRIDEADAAARRHRSVGRATWPWAPDLSSPAVELAMYRESVFMHGRVVGAFDGAALRGFVAVLPGWIGHLYVAVGHQGEGIGSALLAIAKEPADALELWTYQANHATQHFYERHGFVVAEMTDGSALPERVPNIRYRWQR